LAWSGSLESAAYKAIGRPNKTPKQVTQTKNLGATRFLSGLLCFDAGEFVLGCVVSANVCRSGGMDSILPKLVERTGDVRLDTAAWHGMLKPCFRRWKVALPATRA